MRKDRMYSTEGFPRLGALRPLGGCTMSTVVPSPKRRRFDALMTVPTEVPPNP